MVASGPSSRRASLSSVGRNSSGRSGSATSSRSTSFNLPNEARGEIRAVEAEPDDEVEGEEMDEEGEGWVLLRVWVSSLGADLGCGSRCEARCVCQSARTALFERGRGYEGMYAYGLCAVTEC